MREFAETVLDLGPSHTRHFTTDTIGQHFIKMPLKSLTLVTSVSAMWRFVTPLLSLWLPWSAFGLVGSWFDRPNAFRQRQGSVCDSGNVLLHKVGWSRILGNHHWGKDRGLRERTFSADLAFLSPLSQTMSANSTLRSPRPSALSSVSTYVSPLQLILRLMGKWKPSTKSPSAPWKQAKTKLRIKSFGHWPNFIWNMFISIMTYCFDNIM